MTVTQAAQKVVVIGAGIIGVCAANALADEGFAVEFIDPLEPGSPGQCSYGNAGGLSPGSCIPNSMPGIARQVPGMLLDREGPIGLRLLDLPHALPWLLRFLANSRLSRVQRIADGMIELNRLTLACYEPLVKEAGCADLILHRGQLFAYENPNGPAGSALSIAMRRERGVRVEVLNAAQMRELEPAISPDYKAGVFLPEQGQCPNPGRLVASIAALARRKGVVFTRQSARSLVMQQGRVVGVATEAGMISATKVVVAAGAFSGPFARQVGVRVPLVSERGYHIMLPHAETGLRVNVNAAERKFVAAPMEGGLRLSGTVEFARPSAAPNWRRAEILLGQARHMFPGADLRGVERWMGNRPGTPDSIPVIEVAPRHDNVILAFGHGHQGLMGGSVTGRLVAELATGKPTSIDISHFRSARF
ncbi:NAD(P)/FAD-dependent oxidoreductase [Fuscibacter oryzae]|uniref:FAD-dependent oxidoreductase n=1 Tax=Fuscibacter oryzae TaxID=2803939 RepID=A0A8J7MWL2_9RHOB|nr:FAD-dependent oxidoreductase [Fuscibacter oryzae]MBL4930023.1 FAD-dependent oxidoreductase [Fuscibacter oryzae]